MKPTEKEREWAIAIKHAAQEDAEIQEEVVTDLEYLHHAVIAKDQVHKALKRIKRMQKFKDDYGIKLDGSYEEGMRDITAFLAAHPGFVLSLAVLPQDQSIVLCCDYGNFQASSHHTRFDDENFAITLRGWFYFGQASQSNLAAMRAGVSTIVDVQGTSWRNFSLEMERRAAALYSHAYPIRIRQMVEMNCNIIVRAFFQFAALFQSKKVRERRVCCGHHRAFLASSRYTPNVLPQVWGGELSPDDTVLPWLRKKLKERYDWEAKFAL